MLNRRRFLKATAYSAVCSALTLPIPYALRGSYAAAPSRPPLLDATQSAAFKLTATAGETEFLPGSRSRTLGFNQAYLGPVVRVRAGTEVAATVENGTEFPISVHWHGLLVTGDVDGGPHQSIPPGGSWQPRLAIDQPPATLWYHSHLHGQTAPRVYAGLAGVLIVDDGRDVERGLPSAQGADDFVLVLQDKRFNAAAEAVYEPGPADLMHGFLGDAILVNGTYEPQVQVPAGIVRLRLVNAANARNFELLFPERLATALIATDQGYLPRPIAIDTLRLTPGERAEVLVDFSGGGTETLSSMPHEETRGAMAMGGMAHDMLPLSETFTAPFPVIDFVVDPSLPVGVRSMPATLDGDDEELPSPIVTREFVLNDMGMMMGGGMMGGMGGTADMFGINGKPFEMTRLDFEAKIGTSERWLVSGQMMGHPFHIHGVRFRVISENGGPPRPENRGWKDTVFVSGEVELLVRLEHGAAAATPYMMHCHILEHEDAGMMSQFTVS